MGPAQSLLGAALQNQYTNVQNQYINEATYFELMHQNGCTTTYAGQPQDSRQHPQTWEYDNPVLLLVEGSRK